MRYSIAFVAVILSALALSACDRQPAVAPTPPVVITVPGPPGPQGPAGAPAEKGATGAQGTKGEQGDSSILVVPAPAPQR